MPRRIQGPDTVPNLLFLCFPCHRAIHQDEASAAQVGFIVMESPESVPLLHNEYGWTYLGPDGDFAGCCVEGQAG